jgi:hypothetical protein
MGAQIAWINDYEDALARAGDSGKRVLLDFFNPQ